MKTTFDVLDQLYTALNIGAVTGLIDGAIWRRKKPIDRKLQDIVIVPLDLRNQEDVQPGVFIVNAYCRNHDNGLPNETTLQSIADAVITTLDGRHASGLFFRTDVMSETVLSERDVPDMSYVSLRLNVQIENV